MNLLMRSTLLFLLFLTCFASNGESRLDTIQSQITMHRGNDSLLFSDFIALYRISFYDDFQHSYQNLDSALVYAKKINKSINLATTYGYYGVFHRFAGNYTKSKASTKRSIEYLEQAPNRPIYSMNLYNLGTLELINGAYEEAMNYFLQHLKLNEEAQNWSAVGEAYNNISIIYKETGEFQKSLEYLHRSLQMFKKVDSQYNIGLALGNIASQYQELNEWDSVIKYALATNDIGEQINSDQTIGFANQVLSEAYIGKEDFQKAVRYAQLSLVHYNIHPEPRLMMHSYISLGQAQSKLGILDDAQKNLTLAAFIADTLGYLEGENIVYKYLAEHYMRANNYEEAYHAFQKHKILSDSINSVANTELINELNLKYETTKKDAQINSQELEIHRKNNQRSLYLFGLGLLAMAALYLFGRHRNAQRLAKEKIARLKQMQKLAATENVLQGEENERERIAKELHDGLGGLLATAKLQLQQTKKQHQNGQATSVVQAEKIIEDAYEEVRRISHDMMPNALSNLGLKSAVEDLANKVNVSQKVKVICQLYFDDLKISKAVQIALYRIIQESLNNSLKHAKANQIIIQLTENKEGIHLTVEDDGIGFDSKLMSASSGLGFRNIESRVKYLGGSMNIDGQINQGTSLDIYIPASSDD